MLGGLKRVIFQLARRSIEDVWLVSDLKTKKCTLLGTFGVVLVMQW